MAQVLSLTSPVVYSAPPSTVSYAVVRLLIERVPFARIVIVVQDNNGTRMEAEYRDDQGGTVAAQLISALNTANLSVKSLQERILEKLAADGKLPAGSVTGTPD